MKRIYILIWAAVMVACGGNNVNGNVSNKEIESIAVYEENSSETSDEEADENDNEPNEPHVCSSEDGVVTIESAMHPGGGTAPDYWSRWKFKNNAGKACEVYRGNSPFVSKVHSIKKDDGSTYYIINCFAKASGSDGYEWLEAYKIVGDTIKKVSVIDGGQNINNEEFDINYCVPNWSAVTGGRGFDWIFEYEQETQNLYVPIIIGETMSELQPNDRYHLWHFNGKRFVDMGERPHKDLHSSLANYNQLIKHFETKDYIVRVDSLDSHELRYASWKKPKSIKDKPDIVIKGGFKKVYYVAPDQLCPCDDYRFMNEGYEYIVNYCEVKRTEDGFGEHHDFLLVKKKGRTILRQEKIL